MASALPVVAANAMALPHLVHDGKNGSLFEPGNAQHLADRLEHVLTLPQDELDVLKNASLRIVATRDIQMTISTFECVCGRPGDGIGPTSAQHRLNGRTGR